MTDSDDVPIHPLFVTDDDKPIAEPIAFIHVHRFHSNGRLPCIDVVPAEQLESEPQLVERYGPGTYQLVGRNDSRSRIVRRVTIDVDAPASAASAPSPNAPTAEVSGAAATATVAKSSDGVLLQYFIEEAREARKAVAESNRATLEAIAQLSGARLADQREMIQALSKKEGAGGGVKDYQAGLELGMSLASAMAEQGGGTAEIVSAFAEGMNTLNNLQKGGGNGAPA